MPKWIKKARLAQRGPEALFPAPLPIPCYGCATRARSGWDRRAATVLTVASSQTDGTTRVSAHPASSMTRTRGTYRIASGIGGPMHTNNWRKCLWRNPDNREGHRGSEAGSPGTLAYGQGTAVRSRLQRHTPLRRIGAWRLQTRNGSAGSMEGCGSSWSEEHPPWVMQAHPTARTPIPPTKSAIATPPTSARPWPTREDGQILRLKRQAPHDLDDASWLGARSLTFQSRTTRRSQLDDPSLLKSVRNEIDLPGHAPFTLPDGLAGSDGHASASSVSQE